jgi:hypothetical protein
VIGASAFLINFCALGGVSDILFAKDWRRMRAWLLAVGVAIVATQSLDAAGILALGDTGVAPGSWLAVFVGGVMFGYGMALSGGCISRALVRLGAGSFKSLVILATVGVAAAATQALLGTAESHAVAAPTFSGLAARSGLDADTGRWLFTALFGGGLIVAALWDSWFRSGWLDVAGSMIIGLCIPAAWIFSTFFADPVGVNFAAPAGDILALAAGAERDAGQIFAVAIFAGVPLGALLTAAPTRNLSFETFTERAELLRNLAGASLMGVGGTLALGCTFGQGLSGLSMLSVAAVVALAGMFAGCLWGIRAFEAGGVWGGLKLAVAQLGRKSA